MNEGLRVAERHPAHPSSGRGAAYDSGALKGAGVTVPVKQAGFVRQMRVSTVRLTDWWERSTRRESHGGRFQVGVGKVKITARSTFVPWWSRSE